MAVTDTPETQADQARMEGPLAGSPADIRQQLSADMQRLGRRIARIREHPLRLAAILLLAWGCAYLLYLSIYTNNFSGACYGIRWFVPLLPAGYLLPFAGEKHLHPLER